MLTSHSKSIFSELLNYVLLLSTNISRKVDEKKEKHHWTALNLRHQFYKENNVHWLETVVTRKKACLIFFVHVDYNFLMWMIVRVKPRHIFSRFLQKSILHLVVPQTCLSWTSVLVFSRICKLSFHVCWHNVLIYHVNCICGFKLK